VNGEDETRKQGEMMLMEALLMMMDWDDEDGGGGCREGFVEEGKMGGRFSGAYCKRK